MGNRKGEGRATRLAADAATKVGLANLMPLRKGSLAFWGSADVNKPQAPAAQLGSIGHWARRKAQEGAVADLLNILPDIEERLLMGVEVGAWSG